MNTEIILGIGMFTAIVLALAVFIIAARSKLVSSGDVTIDINGEKKIVVPAGGKLLQTLSGSDTAIASMAFQPRGGRLAIATLDGKLTLWDARAGTLGTTIQAPRQGGRFSALAFSPDGTLLMTGSPASDVAFWDAQSGAAAGALPAFDLNHNGVYAAAFSPDGQRLAVGLGDQSVQIFELGAGR